MPVFTANIPGILKAGDKIEIGGKIKQNARKMSVNLCAQEGEEPPDVVLHFDVRFHRDNIISLSRKNGVWIGSGNYDTNYNMFVPGTLFRIIFEVKDSDVITIYCQGKFHSNFLPKIPLGMAKYIVAWSDVEKITHCYFHMGKNAKDEEPLIGIIPQTPRAVAVATDMNRLRRPHKKPTKSVPDEPCVRSSSESSDDEDEKCCMRVGVADRCFYDTLMCNPAEYQREGCTTRTRPGPSRRYHESDEDRYDYTSASKDEDSYVESDTLRERGRSRPGRTAPSSPRTSPRVPKKRSPDAGGRRMVPSVVNFMGRSSRKT